MALPVVVVACWGASAALAEAAPDELIVRFGARVDAAERAAIRKEARTIFKLTLPLHGMQLLQVEPGQSATEARRALEREHGVLYAEPNATRRTFLRPNDPYLPMLWAMENTGQEIGRA